MFETLLIFEKFLKLIEGNPDAFIRTLRQNEKITTPEFLRDMVDMLLFYRHFILDVDSEEETDFEAKIKELIRVYQTKAQVLFKSKWFTDKYMQWFIRD